MFLESKAYVYKAQPPAYINYDPIIMHGSAMHGLQAQRYNYYS